MESIFEGHTNLLQYSRYERNQDWYSMTANYSRALLFLATEELSQLGEVWPLIPLLITALPITSQHTRLIVL